MKVLSKTWKNFLPDSSPHFPQQPFCFNFSRVFHRVKKKKRKKKVALISNTMFCLPWRIKVSSWRTLFFLISFSDKAEQTRWNIWELSEFPSNLGSLPTDDIPLISLLWRHLEIPPIFFHFLIWSLIPHMSYWNSCFGLASPSLWSWPCHTSYLSPNFREIRWVRY